MTQHSAITPNAITLATSAAHPHLALCRYVGSDYEFIAVLEPVTGFRPPTDGVTARPDGSDQTPYGFVLDACDCHDVEALARHAEALAVDVTSEILS